MTKRQAVPTEQHTCDECKHATYDMQHKNLSIYGKPTLIVCALHPRPKRVVGSRACEDFEMMICKSI